VHKLWTKNWRFPRKHKRTTNTLVRLKREGRVQALGFSSQKAYLRGKKKFGNFGAKSFCHFDRANVGNTMERQINMHWLGRGDVVLDVLNDQLHQVRIGRNQYRYKEITLKRSMADLRTFRI